MTQRDLCAALLAADAGCRIFCCTYFALLFAVQPYGGLLCAVSGILIEMGVIGCVRPETRAPRTPAHLFPLPTSAYERALKAQVTERCVSILRLHRCKSRRALAEQMVIKSRTNGFRYLT